MNDRWWRRPSAADDVRRTRGDARAVTQRGRVTTGWSWVALLGLAVGAAVWWGVRASSSPPPNADPEPSRPATADGERIVRGRVFGPDGAPVAGAGVALFRLQGTESTLPTPFDERAVQSGSDGRFARPYVPERDLAVGARMPGLISALVPIGDGKRELVLRMQNTYELQGYVSDSLGPVEGCEVVLEPDEERLFAHVARAGVNGHFRFANVYPGTVTLTARSLPHAPAIRRGVVVGTGETLRLRLHERPLGVQGRVWLDEQGQVPAVGGRVRVTAQPEAVMRLHAVPFETVVRADGSFDVSGLGAGLHRVEIAHADRSTAVRMVEIEERTAADLDVRLLPRAPVRGRLVGGELASVELLLVTDARERAYTRTDTGGRFEFAGRFSVGAASLVLLDRSVCFERTSNRRVGIEVGGEALSLPVAPAAALSGEVVDARGSPIAGVEVFADAERLPGIDLLRMPVAVTDAEGRYQAYIGRGAGAELAFSHPAFAVSMLRLERQASGMQEQMVLHAPSRVIGVVRRGDAPLPAAIVHLAFDSPTRAWATTGPDGTFTLHGVPPGEHQLWVRHGNVSEFSAAVVVMPGVDLRDTALTLPPVRMLEGRVVDGRGDGVEGVLVSVDAGAGLSRTDATGRFALVAQKGEVTLRAFAPEWRREVSTKVNADAADVRIELALPPHGRLRARLQGVRGQRLDGVLMSVRPLAPDGEGVLRPTLQWVDVRDGVLTFPRFPAGRASVALHCMGYLPWTAEVTLAPGGERDLGLCRLDSGARLRGVVVDDKSVPIPGARVVVGRELDLLVLLEAARVRSDDLVGARADLRGRFELAGLSSAAHTLTVYAPGFATATIDLQLPTDLLRQEPLPITLPTGVDIVARVLDAQGQPARGVVVELHKVLALDAAPYSLMALRTDRDGVATFHHRSSGEYRLVIPGTPVRATVDVLQEQTYHRTMRLDAR